MRESLKDPRVKRDKLKQRWSSLQAERSSWVSHWSEISTYLLPRNGRFFTSDRNKGTRRHNAIYDSTGTKALKVLGAGMMAGATSPARPWFRLGTPDPELNKYQPVKVWLDGERYVRTAEGNGPVNALDAALRSAITEIHPHLRDIELVNYKVRILDETKGTGAITRVLIDASDGEQVWGSIGVGENVIAASWQALVDSLEQPMQPGRAEAAAAARRAV